MSEESANFRAYDGGEPNASQVVARTDSNASIAANNQIVNWPQSEESQDGGLVQVLQNNTAASPRSAAGPEANVLDDSCGLVPEIRSDRIDTDTDAQQAEADNFLEAAEFSDDESIDSSTKKQTITTAKSTAQNDLQQTESTKAIRGDSIQPAVPIVEDIEIEKTGPSDTTSLAEHDGMVLDDPPVFNNHSQTVAVPQSVTKSDNSRSPVEIDLTLEDSDEDAFSHTAPSHQPVSTSHIKQEEGEEAQSHTIPQIVDQASFYHDLPDVGTTYIPDEYDLGTHDQRHYAPAEITSDTMFDILQKLKQNSADIIIPPMNDHDSENEDTNKRNEFQKLKAAHEQRKKSLKFTMTDEIDFERAVTQEQMRIRARQSRKQQERDEIEKTIQADSLFIPENREHSASNDDHGTLDRPYAHTDVSFSPDCATEVEAPTKKKSRGRPRGVKSNVSPISKNTADKSRISKKQSGSGTGKGRGKKAKQPAQVNVKSLLHHDIIAEANANQGKAEQTIFTSRNRKDALSQLVSSIPQEERNLHVSDKVALDKALSNFNGRGAIRSDQQGGWLLKGMNSSLKSYQVLGVSWMRDRENQARNPRGGILGDDMGLGKTVSALANIVDGRAPSNYNGAKATLVIVPPGLMSQWLEEVEKHVNILKNVMIYRSKMKIMNMAETLGSYDIVITSYHEVLRSLPPNNPPPHIFTAQAKAEWWAKEVELNKGPLHQVYWYRIVLDEAQAIKNHLSRTSEAICFLRGRYRWCLSGTPVQNGLEEFYPYFRFLKCENTGNFDLFKRNFAKRGSEKALQRLQVYLSKIMLRRTHVDQFLGNPIVKLPPIKPVETKVVKFNAVEHAIYNIVKKRFVQRVNTLSKKDAPGDSYQQILVLLLRLRQLVGHPMLIQKTLKELLEVEDFERLWALTRERNTTQPNADVTSDGNKETAHALRIALSMSQNPGTTGESSSAARTQIDNELNVNFRKYLESLRVDGNWAEANMRSVCAFCANPPTNPYITTCLHLYCYACLNDLRYTQLLDNKDHATCSDCSASIDVSEAYAATAYNEADRRTNTNGRSTPEEDIDWYKIGGPILRSAKVKGAVEQIKTWFAQDPTNKILVFTQFRGMIKVMERVCREEDDWGYASYHGAMSFEHRDRQVRKFSTDPKCRILLAALKAGGVGLNLTAANRVIIFDLWWNVSVESQAFTRCFRIGQERDVEVVRFVVHDSIDIDIQRMQERKIAEIEQAMDDRNRPNLSTYELLELFSDGPERRSDAAGKQIDLQNGEDEPFIFPDDPYDLPDDDDDVVMVE